MCLPAQSSQFLSAIYQGSACRRGVPGKVGTYPTWRSEVKQSTSEPRFIISAHINPGGKKQKQNPGQIASNESKVPFHI